MKEREVPFRVVIEVKEITPKSKRSAPRRICIRTRSYVIVIVFRPRKSPRRFLPERELRGSIANDRCQNWLRRAVHHHGSASYDRRRYGSGDETARQPVVWARDQHLDLPEETLEKFDKDYYLLRDREEMDKISQEVKNNGRCGYKNPETDS